MARYPTPGAVKTRLARVIGVERATALYRAFLTDLDRRFGAAQRELVWAYTPLQNDFQALVSAQHRCIPQHGLDLGTRMLHCFQTLCAEGIGAVIMIGADIPHLPDAWLDEADARLDDVDIVLGPSIDGGYYLVAMRRPHDVFGGIQMGTAHVLAATLRKAADLQLRVHLLPSTFDVDEPVDLQRLRRLLEQSEDTLHLPATLALLRQWDCGSS